MGKKALEKVKKYTPFWEGFRLFIARRMLLLFRKS